MEKPMSAKTHDDRIAVPIPEACRISGKNFLALPPRTADALALWVVHAHCHQAGDVSPILALTSPEKRCGKTRTVTLWRRLVPKPLTTANITAAAVFRSVEKWRPTLLIDEDDS
jgi:hypothetical protein